MPSVDQTARTAAPRHSVGRFVLRDLAAEFLADAESMERIAAAYKAKGMIEQYDILWHEGAIYRNCADRLTDAARNTPISNSGPETHE